MVFELIWKKILANFFIDFFFFFNVQRFIDITDEKNKLGV